MDYPNRTYLSFFWSKKTIFRKINNEKLKGKLYYLVPNFWAI